MTHADLQRDYAQQETRERAQDERDRDQQDHENNMRSLLADAEEEQMTGIELIAAERAEHVTREGWTPEHDAEHDGGEMAFAAAVYALPAAAREPTRRSTCWPGDPPSRGDAHWTQPRFWPWDPEWYKPCPDDRIRELVKAGALIAGEIDRLRADAERRRQAAGEVC